MMATNLSPSNREVPREDLAEKALNGNMVNKNTHVIEKEATIPASDTIILFPPSPTREQHSHQSSQSSQQPACEESHEHQLHQQQLNAHHACPKHKKHFSKHDHDGQKDHHRRNDYHRGHDRHHTAKEKDFGCDLQDNQDLMTDVHVLVQEYEKMKKDSAKLQKEHQRVTRELHRLQIQVTQHTQNPQEFAETNLNNHHKWEEERQSFLERIEILVGEKDKWKRRAFKAKSLSKKNQDEDIFFKRDLKKLFLEDIMSKLCHNCHGHVTNILFLSQEAKPGIPCPCEHNCSEEHFSKEVHARKDSLNTKHKDDEFRKKVVSGVPDTILLEDHGELDNMSALPSLAGVTALIRPDNYRNNQTTEKPYEATPDEKLKSGRNKGCTAKEETDKTRTIILDSTAKDSAKRHEKIAPQQKTRADCTVTKPKERVKLKHELEENGLDEQQDSSCSGMEENNHDVESFDGSSLSSCHDVLNTPLELDTPVDVGRADLSAFLKRESKHNVPAHKVTKTFSTVALRAAQNKPRSSKESISKKSGSNPSKSRTVTTTSSSSKKTLSTIPAVIVEEQDTSGKSDGLQTRASHNTSKPSQGQVELRPISKGRSIKNLPIDAVDGECSIRFKKDGKRREYARQRA